MSFIYELDHYSLEMSRMRENELSTSMLSKVIVRQTDSHDQNYIPHRCASGQQPNYVIIMSCTSHLFMAAFVRYRTVNILLALIIYQ